MSVTKFPYGRPVKLLADAMGFPDGRLVQFEVWKKTRQGEDLVMVVNGVTAGGKAKAEWIPRFEESTVELREGEVGEEAEEAKYYFIARIDDKEAKSGELEFTYPLHIYLEDEEGKPLHDVDFTITFSDGSKRQGKFEHGRAKFEDAPPGKFKLEVEGYTMGSGD